MVVEHAKPFLCCTNDALLLPQRNGFVRITKKIGRSGLDLDKHQDFCAPVSADQIDLASTFGAEITKKNFVAGFSQEADGDLFSSFADAEVCGGCWAWAKISFKVEDRFEPPEQTFDDEGNKARENAISQGVLACHTLCCEQIRKPETPHASRPSYGRG